MKRSIITSQEQKNCEEWLSTRNRKKICPSVASKTLIAHKLASFPFTSKYKLTQNSSPSKQLIIPQHQMSILNFVKKDKISQHQDKQDVRAIKKLFQEKEIISELQEKNTGFASSPQKTMAASATHNKECIFENVLCSTKLCSDIEEKRLEEIQEKIKDFDDYEKSNKENIFSENDIINVEKRSIKNVFIDSDRRAILLNKTNLSPSKTSYISETDYLTCSNQQNTSILNKFESQVNKLSCNPQKKTATTPTKYIKSVNPNLQDSQRISGLKRLKYSLDCNNDMTNLYTKCEKKINALDQENVRCNLGISPSKQILETHLKDNCRQVSSTENILLKQRPFLQKNMVYACPPNECFHLNPAQHMEQKLSNSSYVKTELFNEKIARDSLLDFSENNLDLSFPIYIENSEHSSKKNVFSNFQTDQILDLAKRSNSSQYEEVIEINANSSLPEEMVLTQSVNAVNRYSVNEHDFVTATKSDANTSHCFTGFFEAIQASKQEHSDEHLNLEEDNLEFTLHSQRSIDEEIPHEFMPETDNFTFNSDFI